MCIHCSCATHEYLAKFLKWLAYECQVKIELYCTCRCIHTHTQTHTWTQTHTYMHMYLHIRYCSNATSHSRVPNSRVEHCYTWVNCNDSRVILWLLACSILCVYLVLKWFTHKLHMRSVYTRECPKHTSDDTRYIYIKISQTSVSYKILLTCLYLTYP